MKLDNAIYTGADGRRSLIDLEIPIDFNGELLLFIHGYKGFKDWGAWNLMQAYFVEKGYGYCKFNMSHNGGTIVNAYDFPDLEAFAANTYSKERADVGFVLTYLEKQFERLPKIHLLGHSRGGGIALLHINDPRVNSVITLAAIASIAKRFENEEMIAKWQREGVRYEMNTRTEQKMPLNYSQVLDFEQNSELLNIENSCKHATKPILLIHGSADESVLLSEGEDLAAWTKKPLQIIPQANHVFGAQHPWKEAHLPEHLAQACDLILNFLTS